MQSKNISYLSVYRVLRKGEITVVGTTVFALSLSIAITLIIGWLTKNILLSIILMVASITIIPILVWQHQIVKWKIWAFSRVNNITQLLLKASDSLLVNENLAVTRTIFPYREQKKKIEEIIWDRKNNNLFEISLQDSVFPTRKNIYYSLFRYGWYLVLGFVIFYAAFFIPKYDIGLIIIKILVFSISLFFFYLSVKKLINRKPVIRFDDKGIYTSESGFVKWNDIKIAEVAVFMQSGGRYRYKKKIFRIDYLSDGDMKNVGYNIETLNTSVIELDEIIQTYRNRYYKQW